MKQIKHLGTYGLILKGDDIVLIKKVGGPYDGKLDLPGGTIEFGETPVKALIREIKEELNIDIHENEIKYLVGSTSSNIKSDMIDNHFNECYIITKDLDISDIKLQEEEVAEIKWFSKKEILDRINNNFMV